MVLSISNNNKVSMSIAVHRNIGVQIKASIDLGSGAAPVEEGRVNDCN